MKSLYYYCCPYVLNSFFLPYSQKLDQSSFLADHF